MKRKHKIQFAITLTALTILASTAVYLYSAIKIILNIKPILDLNSIKAKYVIGRDLPTINKTSEDLASEISTYWIYKSALLSIFGATLMTLYDMVKDESEWW